MLKKDSKIIEQINAIDPDANIGIKIRNLKTNKIIYQQNANRHFNFASGTKLFTIFGLREYFGKDYAFSSQILRRGKDFYLRINNPNFSTEELSQLIGYFTSNNIKTIKGNFYIIDDQFTIPSLPKGRMNDDSKLCYGALITKTHIGKNCHKVVMNATSGKILNKDRVVYDIVNNVSIVAPKLRKYSKIDTTIEGNRFIITGYLRKSPEDVSIFVVTNESTAHVKKVLAALLTEANISLKGNILPTHQTKNLTIVAQTEKTFDELGAIALKRSNNFVTDYLLAEFGSRYDQQTWEDTGNLLKKLVFEKIGTNLRESIITDGSGLSYYNLFTVNQFDDFLTRIYHKSDFHNYLSILSQPNEQGGLQYRFKEIRIFAKTGTVTGVSSLVGYVFDDNNTPYSFVIVVNNHFKSKKEYSQLEENIIRAAISLNN